MAKERDNYCVMNWCLCFVHFTKSYSQSSHFPFPFFLLLNDLCLEFAVPLCGIMLMNEMGMSQFHNLLLGIDTVLNGSVCKEYA
jgi:hypothetical protein